MPTTAIGQRRKAPRKTVEKRVIRLELKDGLGHPRWVTADVVDRSEDGLGIVSIAPLKTGSTILVHGDLDGDRKQVRRRAEVKWCLEKAKGAFRAGLEFLGKESPSGNGADAPDATELDCYEILQLSANADLETINRVYRMLAQRYHPDNAATGNSELFVQLCNAYRILSDPEQRAGYDVRYREEKQIRWKIFDQVQVPTGREAEKRKRKGILELLYAKTLHDPDRADMTIRDFEELLGCPREHLEAALWYLKGKSYIQRSDNGRYTITVQGVDETEEHYRVSIPTYRQLPEPAKEN